MAEQVFKRDVLAILVSDLLGPLREPSLGIKERCCIHAMLVIITRAEIYWRIDFGVGHDFMIFT